MERNIYLENAPLGEALDRWFSACRDLGVKLPLEAETVATRESAGRVTSAPLFARLSSPSFHSSAMDGVAVDASSTFGASETGPVRLSLGEDAEMIDTGEPLPEEYDAVIMVEDLNEVAEGVFEIIKPAAPWQNVRPLGEDMVESELIIPQGHKIKPADIGALLNAGHTRVRVRRMPVVAILPTGTELVEDPELAGGGKVMESNSWVLAAFCESRGAKPVRLGLIPDDRRAIEEEVADALEYADAVVVNAGTSAGREDYTRSIVEQLGTVVVHGVSMRPGKPVVLGVARGKPILGLPGFPVANYRAAEEFLQPLLSTFLGLPGGEKSAVRARVARRVYSAPGFDEFVQVKVGRVGGEVIAVPLPRGSGVSMSLVRADGAIRIPAGQEGLERWEVVEVLLQGDGADIEGTILAIGSHDISLDLLASRIKQLDPGLSLASANVGSMGGILAVKQGQAHLAGTHLLDPETGEFNVPYILRQLSPDDVFLVHLAWRTQGFMVIPGNPLGIGDVEDLTRDEVVFVNRQRGSGTRLLLDHLMGREGIDPGEVTGYDREVFTHTSVAAAVAGGTADVGLGVMAAARALKLEFVPVGEERYDLLVARSFESTPGFAAILEVMEDPEFRREVEGLGGYDLSRSGERIALDEGRA